MGFSSGRRIWLGFTLFLCHIPLLLVQAGIHHPRPRHTAVSKRDAISDSGLSSASWIWASGATSGNVAFLKTFSTPGGKNSTFATISLTAVDSFTIWVNGQPIGASSDWQSAGVFTAKLNASTNTFSVLAGNDGNAGAPPAGLLAAIKVHYRDGSIDTVVSDSSWQAAVNIPSDFPTPVDRSNFASAAVAAAFGSGAWGTSVTIPPADPNAPFLGAAGGTWIWSTNSAATEAPAGTVGFRKNIITPSGKTATSATILLTADNTFRLYLNGKYLGAPPYETNMVLENYAWGRAQQFDVGVNAALNTLNVIVTNYDFPSGSIVESPAGLVATIRLQYTDGSSDLVVTDPSWLNGPYTSDAAFLAAPDSALATSFTVAAVGPWPWGALSDIANVLAATDVPKAPFSSNVASASGGNTVVGGAAGGGTAGGGTAGGGAAGGTNAGAGSGSNGNSQSGGSAMTPGAGGNGGTSNSSPSATAHLGADQSTASGGAANFGGGASSGTGTGGALAGPTTGSNSGSTSPVPIAAIVGAIASTLTLIIVGLAVLFWRRRRQSSNGRRGSQGGSSITPMLAESTVNPSASSRTSVVSLGRAEMAELQPQRLGGGNSQSPNADLQSQRFGNTNSSPQAVEPMRPPSPQHLAIIPPTKLERESMMQVSASSVGASVSNGPSLSSHASLHDHSESGSRTAVEDTSSRRPFEGSDTETAYDRLTSPPPSYYAE